MGEAQAAVDLLFKIGQFSVFAIGLGTVLWKLSAMMTRFDMHGDKIEKMETGLAEMSKAMTVLAVQTNRLDGLDREIAALRRGKGFIQQDVDGEYSRPPRRD